MRIAFQAILILTVTCLLSTLARAAEPANLISGELLASSDGIAAGNSFTIGVLLKIAPGWHIYWKNPGDAGDAPRFTFKLPPGYTVGDVRFPLPTRFDQAGNIVGYGYKDTALFTAIVTPPKDLSPGTQALACKVDWLCCQEVCKPGTTTLELNLPAKPDAAPANEEIFRKAEALIPLDAPPTATVVGITTEMDRKSPTAAGYRVAIQWKLRPVVVEVFPEDVENLVVQDVDLVGEGSISTVMMTCRLLTGQTLKTKALPLLVTYQDASGRHGFYTKLDLQTLQATKP